MWTAVQRRDGADAASSTVQFAEHHFAPRAGRFAPRAGRPLLPGTAQYLSEARTGQARAGQRPDGVPRAPPFAVGARGAPVGTRARWPQMTRLDPQAGARA